MKFVIGVLFVIQSKVTADELSSFKNALRLADFLLAMISGTRKFGSVTIFFFSQTDMILKNRRHSVNCDFI